MKKTLDLSVLLMYSNAILKGSEGAAPRWKKLKLIADGSETVLETHYKDKYVVKSLGHST